MNQIYKTFKALPHDCHSFLSRKVPEDQADELVKLYCEECERRHAFEPTDD